MNLSNYILILVCNLGFKSASTLRRVKFCYTCQDVVSLNDCTSLRKCSNNQDTCITTVRRHGNEGRRERITRGCSQKNACIINERNNINDCPEKCVFCCYSDRCNTTEQCPKKKVDCKPIYVQKVPDTCQIKVRFQLKGGELNANGFYLMYNSTQQITNATINTTVDEIQSEQLLLVTSYKRKFECKKIKSIVKLVKNSFIYRCKTTTRKKRFLKSNFRENTSFKNQFFTENYKNINKSSEQLEFDPFFDYINSFTKKTEIKHSTAYSDLYNIKSNETVFNVTCDFVPKEKAKIYDSEAHRVIRCENIQYLKCGFVPRNSKKVEIKTQFMSSTMFTTQINNALNTTLAIVKVSSSSNPQLIQQVKKSLNTVTVTSVSIGSVVLGVLVLLFILRKLKRKKKRKTKPLEKTILQQKSKYPALSTRRKREK